MRILGRRKSDALLRFSRKDWTSLIQELGRRGGGKRESGAFLLGHQLNDRRMVTRVVYLDDLDARCLQGNIHIDGKAYSKLWDLCEGQNLRVIGDVHTHIGEWVGQSRVDASNPMIAQDGHVALIVPRFAMKTVRPSEVGVHVYLGERGWTSWTGAGAARRLFIGRYL